MKRREKETGVAVDLLKMSRHLSAITAAGKKTCTGQCERCSNRQKKQTM